MIRLTIFLRSLFY